MAITCVRASILAVVFAFVGLAPATADLAICDGVGVACSLENLGGNQYRYTFQVVNGSLNDIAIFKWRVDPPHIPAEWTTVSFDVPTGWTGSHPDHHLDFTAGNNANGNANRIFSPSLDHCGAGPSLTFRWTFNRNDGEEPACFNPILDYTIHYQPIVVATCNNSGNSATCPGVIPVEPTTWGSIKSVYR